MKGKSIHFFWLFSEIYGKFRKKSNGILLYLVSLYGKAAPAQNRSGFGVPVSLSIKAFGMNLRAGPGSVIVSQYCFLYKTQQHKD